MNPLCESSAPPPRTEGGIADAASSPSQRRLQISSVFEGLNWYAPAFRKKIRPSLSADARTLYFGSTRDNSNDVYAATREAFRGRDR